MQDGSTTVAEEIEVIDLSEDPQVKRQISISKNLAEEEKKN